MFRLPSSKAHHASVAERLNYIEQLVGKDDALWTFDRVWSSLPWKADDVQSRYPRIGALIDSNLILVPTRTYCSKVGDSFERHSKEIQSSHTRLETMPCPQSEKGQTMSLCQTGFMETVRIAGRHSRLTACETDACTLDILDILMTCLETEVRKM